ncbi:hypothetical protein M1590_01905 [Candidatus Marsarchaeota archaeon]|nr:hypothetical protein [Candidatus Marsarchaeota archaeon]
MVQRTTKASTGIPRIDPGSLLRPVRTGLSEEGIKIQETARQKEPKMALLEIFNSKNNYYKDFQNALCNVSFELSDIEILCPKIEINDNTGYFISAAINKIIKESDTVTLDFNGAKVDHVAYRLQKGHVILTGPAGDSAGWQMSGSAFLTINGSAGDYAGAGMSDSASLTINGSAGDYAGAGMSGSASLTINGPAGNYAGRWMSGSASLTIYCSVGDYAGQEMSGSARLTIKQNAGNTVGVYSSGGTIEIEGDIGSIADSCKAEVSAKKRE